MGEQLEEFSMRASPTRAAISAPLHVTHDTFLAERSPGADEDVHMVSSIVDYVISHYTEPGDLVLDPFAGFGTTLDRAVALGRQALGVELLPERVAHIHARTPTAAIIEGDARGLLAILEDADLARSHADIKLILTSPPYMTAQHHDADPLTAYEQDNGDYGRYLRELELVAAQCARLVTAGGFVVWNVADIFHKGQTTHLIADCTRVLERHLTRVDITEIVWDQYPHDLVRDALLIFHRER